MGLSGLGDGGDDDCDDYDCYSREYFGLLAWDGIYNMYSTVCTRKVPTLQLYIHSYIEYSR